MSRAARIFRPEALEFTAAGRSAEGEVLALASPWTGWAYWLVLLAFAAALLLCTVAQVHHIASGPAVVQIAGRSDVTAAVPGSVSAIEVRAGQRVEAGQPLVRLEAARESAELDRLQRELDVQLVKLLREPADKAAQQALASLRAERALAAAKLEEKTIRAPHAGRAGDLRIRSGQRLEAGDVVLTLLGDDARGSVVAMLPGQHRPQLRPGMPLRFEVTGYKYAYLDLEIGSVGTELIGPGEVRRSLRQPIADTVKIDGPVVLVEARLPFGGFRVDQRSLDFYPGMSGVAEVKVRSESLLVALIPGLRLLDRGGR
ncbi:HlyD family efflux transporter periplasmic adaptor subunit [Sorangium sp. So ce296]|uniref:HlyD family efflux transporter periplasmic adaptor subunit n=1 Tax=Sorangium sp. So ce296 TaxID=3133296 RepID=UPI003F622974